MIMKKMFFVYNPHAGKGQLAQKLSSIINIFTKGGYEVTARPTMYSGEAIGLIENLEDGYDMIAVSGGDGTLDEVVTGLMRRDASRRPVLGYIPSGSTNDFGVSIGIPRDILKAAHVIVDGVPFACDMGRLNGNHVFVYVAAFGLFTDVPYETPQEMKNRIGHLAYLLECTKRLSNIETARMKVSYDDTVIEDEFLDGIVTNSRSVGGFSNVTNKHHVAFDDGLLEVTLIRKPKNAIELQNIINALLIQDVSSEYLITFQAKEVTFESEEEVAWTLDGEDGGKYRKVNIKADVKAVDLMLPSEALESVSYELLLAKYSPDNGEN